MQAQKEQSHARGYGSKKVFLKNCTTWCILVHSSAHFRLKNFAVLECFFVCVFLMLPLQKSLKTKKMKKLKCDLMVLKAVLTSDGSVLLPFWLQRKQVPA